MNEELLKIQVHRCDGVRFGVINRHTLRCIPNPVIGNLLGKIELRGWDKIVLNQAALEYIEGWAENNEVPFVYDEDDVMSDTLIRFINLLSPIDPIIYRPRTHPCYLYEGQPNQFLLTFRQLISYNIQMLRNKSEGNKVEVSCHSDGMVGLKITYASGGGIFIGIEKDGYAHS